MKRIIAIAVAGTPPKKALNTYGNFEQWIQGNHPTEDFIVFDAAEPEQYPNTDTLLGVIITGSASMVTDREPWVVRLEQWVQTLTQHQVPTLGICYGHQLLAQALGGTVEFHPQGREIGTVPIELTDACEQDPLFSLSPKSFSANVTHAQSVSTLPPDSVLLAKNNYEPIHAFRVGSCAWGVQFHPEFTANVMRFYLFERYDSLIEQGLDIKQLFDGITNTEESRAVLDNFIALCQS
ncbi:MAG: GMP synthase [Moraxellaceae bacterium]|nr:MAG: GMP synthase [Moraxellaceae bacterium]